MVRSDKWIRRMARESGLIEIVFLEMDEECEADYVARGRLYQGQEGIAPPKVTKL